MPDVTVLHVHPGTAVGEKIQTKLAAVPALDVQQCETIDGIERWLQERDVDCLVGGCELPDGDGRELVARARQFSPDVGCVLYGSERPDVDSAAADHGIAEFVPVDDRTAVDRVVDIAAVTGRSRTQTSYPLPTEERERLESLDRYDIGSDELARELREIVDEAASHLDVPQATINVIGRDEQEFAVCHDEDWAPIPRQDSICTFSILSEGPTVVPDAAADARFEETDALSEMGIRSYAGAPIEPEPGRPIATLCVYDEQPGRFDEADAAYLQALARDAATVIARERDDGAEVRR